MTEENNLTSEADELPPASQKTKEQWLEEGNVLTFYAPIRHEEGLAAYEQALRLDPTYGLAHRMKGYTLRARKRENLEHELQGLQIPAHAEPSPPSDHLQQTL